MTQLIKIMYIVKFDIINLTMCMFILLFYFIILYLYTLYKYIKYKIKQIF